MSKYGYFYINSNKYEPLNYKETWMKTKSLKLFLKKNLIYMGYRSYELQLLLGLIY